MTDQHEFEAHFGALREKFRERLTSYRERLIEGLTLFAKDPSEDAVRKLRSVAHELAGAGGTFGYPELSELASELEGAADRVLAGDDRPASMIGPLRQLIREVELSQ
jgi:HPt (histidine-containing phosphotransfer) domain-containing protein